MEFPEIPAGAVPRVHGNGFIQVDLNEDGSKRLHVWHDGIPRQAVATPIHDHVFDMRSTVLCGTLIHNELEPRVPRAFHDGTHRVFRARQEPGTQNTILEPDNDAVCLLVVETLVLGAGSTYRFPAGKLHTSFHRGLTATVMEKVAAPTGYGRPRVLVPVGSEPDNEFRRDGFDPDILWPFISMARAATEPLGSALVHAELALLPGEAMMRDPEGEAEILHGGNAEEGEEVPMQCHDGAGLRTPPSTSSAEPEWRTDGASAPLPCCYTNEALNHVEMSA